MNLSKTPKQRIVSICLACSLLPMQVYAQEESGLSGSLQESQVSVSDSLQKFPFSVPDGPQQLPLSLQDSFQQFRSSLQDSLQQFRHSVQGAGSEAEQPSSEESAGDSLPKPRTFHLTTPENIAGFPKELPFYAKMDAFFWNNFYSLPQYDAENMPRVVVVGEDYVIVQPIWDYFEQQIISALKDYQGEWSVYIKDLTTGRTMRINDRGLDSASLIKLFIAGAVLEQIEEKELEDTDTVAALLDAMITVSDNESANELVRLLCDDSGDFQTGLDVVNDFIQRYGFSNTWQVNGIADPNLWVSGATNTTSAADCGRFLEMVYDGTLISRAASERLLGLLIRQEVDYKIPSALPPELQIAHKTGEVSDVENDVSIIYTPYGNYIFCVMSNDLENTDMAVDHIRQLTKTVYEYFTAYVQTGTLEDPAIVEYLKSKPYILL